VVTVAVGVDDHLLDGGAAFAFEPFVDDEIVDAGDVVLASAGVDERGLVIAEDDVEEGFFVVRAAGFAEDVEVCVVFVDLPFWLFHTFGAAGDPFSGEDTGFDARAVGLRDLRIETKDA
jgi:hypothetical protein